MLPIESLDGLCSERSRSSVLETRFRSYVDHEVWQMVAGSDGADVDDLPLRLRRGWLHDGRTGARTVYALT